MPAAILSDPRLFHSDAGYRMDLHPLSVERVLHVYADDADVRADRRYVDLVLVVAARGHCVSLGHVILADDFEYQVSTLGAFVAIVQQAFELRIDFEPAVRITIRFVAHAIRLFALGRVEQYRLSGSKFLVF